MSDTMSSDPMRRERMLVCGAVILLVLFRSVLPVFEPYLAFNSDQAIFGLMGKHILERRAFPVFMYGQNYILAVEAWMAVPMFLLFGVSVAALKLPLLLVNIAIGLLLVLLIERELGLRPRLALVPALFFVLAPPGMTYSLLEAGGGNVEPFLYVLLLWLLRARPIWFGVILGVGFLHREFTIYALLALSIVEWATGEWRMPGYWTTRFRGLRLTAEIWLVVQFVKNFASAAGPGTTAQDVITARNNVLEIWNRFCFDPRALAAGVGKLVTFHWPRLFGVERSALSSFGFESQVVEGLQGSGWLLAALALLVAGRAFSTLTKSGEMRRYRLGAYLSLVGALSAGMFVLGRCGFVDIMRYDLLSALGLAGLTAWALASRPPVWLTSTIVALTIAWAAVSGAGHTALWVEQTQHPPPIAKRTIVRGLEARGIRYATADYWIAYYVAFMTGERVIVASSDVAKILEYERLVAEHKSESVRISRDACGAGNAVFDGVYLCPP